MASPTASGSSTSSDDDVPIGTLWSKTKQAATEKRVQRSVEERAAEKKRQHDEAIAFCLKAGSMKIKELLDAAENGSQEAANKLQELLKAPTPPAPGAATVPASDSGRKNLQEMKRMSEVPYTSTVVIEARNKLGLDIAKARAFLLSKLKAPPSSSIPVTASIADSLVTKTKGKRGRPLVTRI